MSRNLETSEGDEVLISRRGRSSSMVSTSPSSLKGKQGGSKALRKSSSLPGETVEYLKAWMMSPDHVAHPYPTEQEKLLIMEETGIELKQLTNWFVNNRKRYWKPRVEARLQLHGVTATPTLQDVVSTGTPSEAYSPEALLQPITASVIQASEPSGPPSPNTFAQAAPASAPEPVHTYVPVANEGPSTVSDVSLGCDSGATSDSNSTAGDSTVSEEMDQVAGIIVRSENIDIHILRPDHVLDKLNEKFPTLEDVTILPDVPSAQILRSYRNITMVYHFSKDISCDDKQVSEVFDQTSIHFMSTLLCEPQRAHRIVPSFS
jgi:hypothetical protein